jgi:exopolysaccharide biosynthesis polyprenyl glycosylphosphotransferase
VNRYDAGNAVFAPTSRWGLGGDPVSRRFRLALIVLLVDVCCIGLAFALAAMLQIVFGNLLAVALAVVPIYLGTAVNAGAYAIPRLRRTSRSIGAALLALTFTFGTLFLMLYFLRSEQQLSRLVLLATMALSGLLLMVWRAIVAYVIKHRIQHTLAAELLIVHGTAIAPRTSVRTVRAADMEIEPDLRDPTMLNRFAALVRNADRVVIACSDDRRQDWAMMLKGANVRGEVVVDYVGMVGAIGISSFADHTTLTVSAGPLDLMQRATKRVFDIALCVPILVLMAPLLLLTAIAIKIDSPGPVLFRQRRVGRANAFFDILKFRSMRVEQADADGRRSASRHDDRITRVGRIIRRTSIDEMPQLLNVLGGSMSLVGPRPHALGSLAGESLFWDIDERYWHRHVLKPGITGLAQVRGLRGATVHRDDLIQRLQADLEYAADWSLWEDVVILVSTLKVIVHKNTY